MAQVETDLLSPQYPVAWYWDVRCRAKRVLGRQTSRLLQAGLLDRWQQNTIARMRAQLPLEQKVFHPKDIF